MFLATTAIQSLWNKQDRILFLGEWCKLYDQRNIWSNLDYEVIPYHWNDRKKLYSDYLYIKTVYEEYLIHLSNKLNEIHRVNFSLRYWRIILGPWLQFFIEILYDRYSSIKNAIHSGKVNNTWILSINNDRWTSFDLKQFIDWIVSDAYNHYIYSRIIERLEGLPFEYKCTDISPSLRNKSRVTIPIMPKVILCKMIYGSGIERCIPKKFKKFIFISSYFKPIDLMKLSFSLRQFPFFIDPESPYVECEINSELREQVFDNENKSEFHNLLDSLVFAQIPKVYLEGYSGMQKASLKAFPKNPTIIYTANAHVFNEGFKYWSAYQVENGAKLIVGQHGGHYGTGLFSSLENHEIEISDKYFSWGWVEKKSSKITPLPSQKTTQYRKRNRVSVRNHCKYFYLNLNIAPRYFYRLFSVPIASQWLDYVQFQIDFIKNLNSDVKEKLFCRPYGNDYDWKVIDRIKSKVENIKFDFSYRQWEEILPKTSIAIETTNLTTLLESMAADVPTIILLQSKYWELNDSAQQLFNKLKKVGVYHTNANSAALMVNKIAQDPMAWWKQKEIQKAKNEFCHQYARPSTQFIKSWKREFKKA